MSEKIYPKGIRLFPKHEKQPDFVKGAVVISLNELVTFCKENPELLSEYKGEKQLKLQLLQGRNGLQMVVDTYKRKESNGVGEAKDDLPF